MTDRSYRRLTPAEKAGVVLSHLGGATHATIAKELGTSTKTVARILAESVEASLSSTAALEAAAPPPPPRPASLQHAIEVVPPGTPIHVTHTDRPVRVRDLTDRVKAEAYDLLPLLRFDEGARAAFPLVLRALEVTLAVEFAKRAGIDIDSVQPVRTAQSVSAGRTTVTVVGEDVSPEPR